MSLFTEEQRRALNELVNNVPGLKKAQLAQDIQLGDTLETTLVPTIASADASDLGTAITLVNEIKATLNALPKP